MKWSLINDHFVPAAGHTSLLHPGRREIDVLHTRYRKTGDLNSEKMLFTAGSSYCGTEVTPPAMS
jgi:hypothetical protein